MEPNEPAALERTVSISSSSSNLSRKSSQIRLRNPHRQRSTASLRSSAPATPITPTEDHSLTSFPSLSPRLEETSPGVLNNPIFQTSISDRLARTDNEATPRPLPPPQLVPTVFEDLLSPTSPSTEAIALFDDAPRGIRDVPGTLHHQSDEHVERMIGRMGAVTLVKQLAQDLAERDAQITLLQRRAEEREALLRKMLRDCEVSNLDIENRLRELRKASHEQPAGVKKQLGPAFTGNGVKKIGTRPDASLSDRLAEAFEDQYQGRSVTPPNGTALVDDLEDNFPTPRPLRVLSPRDIDGGSTYSGTSTISRKSGTVRGWKDYFRTTGETTSSETQQPNKRQTNGDLHSPPLNRMTSSTFEAPPALLRHAASHAFLRQGVSSAYRERLPSTDETDSTTSKSSGAGWITRLVAGGTKASTRANRDRAVTISTDNSGKSLRPVAMPPTKGQNKVQAMSGNRPPSGHSVASALSNSKTVRRVGPDNARPSVADLAPPVSSHSNHDSDLNYGPVEMDTILPDEKRPPTLIPYYNYGASADYLTDRFGFIYDQRRRRRQNDAVAALPMKKRTELAESLRNAAGAPATHEGRKGRSRASSMKSATRPDTAGSVENHSSEQPAKRWQDYLNLTSIGTELLSHTPYAAPITNITAASDSGSSDAPTRPPSQIVISKRGSIPTQTTNPPLSPTRAVSGNAELTTHITTSASAADQTLPSISAIDPVKALLDQVNDVHDGLQREKTVRWNEFLRKVRAERRRDEESATSNTTSLASRFARKPAKPTTMPEALLADGEFVGVAGLGVKGKVGRAKGSEFRNLVLNGIPVAYRAKIWAECCGANNLRVPSYYDELVNSDFTDEVIAQQIQADITRTLTDNIFFRAGQGVAKLDEVLRAYARRNPVVGYCQGMNLITANLLLIMPAAEDAFWILASIVEDILPAKYYDSSLLGGRADQAVLRQYVAEVLPTLSTHFENLSIDLEAVTFQWFLSLFTDCLSAEALFRVWDVVLCLNDGATFLFQVALALLKLNEKRLLECESPAEVYGYINQRMTDHAISIDGLIRASEGLKGQVRREEVVERRDGVLREEEELARERERIRDAKGKGRADGGGGGGTGVSKVGGVEGQEPPKTVVLDSSTADNITHHGHSNGTSSHDDDDATPTGTDNSRGLSLNTAIPASASTTPPATTTTSPNTQQHPPSFSPTPSTTTSRTASASSSTILTPPHAQPSKPKIKKRKSLRSTSSSKSIATTSISTYTSTGHPTSTRKSLSRKSSMAELFPSTYSSVVDSPRGSFDSMSVSTYSLVGEEENGGSGYGGKRWEEERDVKTPMPVDEEVFWRG